MKWRTAALERLANGELNRELDLFERYCASVGPLGFRQALWVMALLDVGGYRIAAE